VIISPAIPAIELEELIVCSGVDPCAKVGVFEEVISVGVVILEGGAIGLIGVATEP